MCLPSHHLLSLVASPPSCLHSPVVRNTVAGVWGLVPNLTQARAARLTRLRATSRRTVFFITLSFLNCSSLIYRTCYNTAGIHPRPEAVNLNPHSPFGVAERLVLTLLGPFRGLFPASQFAGYPRCQFYARALRVCIGERP